MEDFLESLKMILGFTLLLILFLGVTLGFFFLWWYWTSNGTMYRYAKINLITIAKAIPILFLYLSLIALVRSKL